MGMELGCASDLTSVLISSLIRGRPSEKAQGQSAYWRWEMYPNTLNTHLSTGYPSLSKYMQPRDDHFKILESVKQAMPDQGRVYQSDRTSIDDACAVLERGRSHAALKILGTGVMVRWSRTWTALAKDASLTPSTHVRQCTIACNSSSKGIQHLWPLWASTLTCVYPYTQLKIK